MGNPASVNVFHDTGAGEDDLSGDGAILSQAEKEEAQGYLPEERLAVSRPAGLRSELEANAQRIRKIAGKEKKKSLAKDPETRHVYTAEQRILLIDTWKRSGLPRHDFASLVGMSPNTLYTWSKNFDKHGPEGIMDHPKGAKKGSRLPEVTKRMILMIKDENPEYGCRKISDLLARGPGVPASESAVSVVLKENGYECTEEATEPHPDKQRRFERAAPGQLWQTDLFTFTMKRQNRRVHMVAFMDDHSRFITGYAIHGVASTEMVIESFRVAIAAFPAPEELLTDNGPQYCTWRGVSRFTKECSKLGVRQIVSRPRHPQTLGKIERFWGTLWRDFLKQAVFLDLEDARRRIGLFIDHYNFQRPHQSLEGLTPADRYFGVAPEVMASMKTRLQENALEIAKNGFPKKPFYLSGQIDGRTVSLHEESGRVFMIDDKGQRQEVELVTPYGMSADEKEELAAEAAAIEPQCPDGSPEPAPFWGERPVGGNSLWERQMENLADSLEKGNGND
jgi:transposase InsO family protein